MAEAKIITGANAKGGAGKTMSLILLGTELAHRGNRVLIIDTDSEQNITSWFNRCIENNNGVSNIDHEYAGTSNKLLDILRHKINMYDYILIDTPGRLEKFQHTAFIVSNIVLIPVQACQSELKGMITSLNTIMEIEEQENISIQKYVFNTRITLQDRHIKEYQLIGDFVKELKNAIPNLEHCPVEFGQRNAYREVYSGGASLRDLTDAKRDSVIKAITEASEFTDAVLNQLATGE